MILGGPRCREPVARLWFCFPAGVCSPGAALLELICFPLCKEMPRTILGCRKRRWVLILHPAWSFGDEDEELEVSPA